MRLLEGRVALLSGVGGGLGRDTALLFAQHGAKLVLVARSDALTSSIAQEVSALDSDCLVLVGDITSTGDCQRIAADAVAQFGKIDILVNIAHASDYSARCSILDVDPDLEGWRQCFEVNVFATMKITKAVAHHMADIGSGRIIMINSMTAERIQPGSFAYSGSKSALQRMTQVLAQDLSRFGIRVNGLHPGFMWGPSVENSFLRHADENGTSVETEKARIEEQIPLGYMPPTNEYAGTLLYLASDLSLPMTGQSLHVNGGQWMPK